MIFNGNLPWKLVAPLAQMGILFGIFIFLIEGLYPGYGITAVKELEKMSKSVIIVFLFLAGVSYFNKPFQDLSRAFLLISWILALLILPLSHFIIRNLISRFPWYGIPVVIFGESDELTQILVSLKRVRRLGWRTKLVLPINAIKDKMIESNLFNVAIFVPSPGVSIDEYAHILNKNYRKVILISQTEGLGSVWVVPRDLDGNLGLEFRYNLFDGFSIGIKRLMDIGIGLFLFLSLSAVILILSLLIYLDSPGPIFFRQDRLGKGYKQFKIIKFRTMVLDAEEKLNALLEKDPVAQSEYLKDHKLSNDPRLTRIGKFVRRFSLDELPQILNVLSGSMSIVGPRAYMPSELDEMGDYSPIIMRIQPGLTGWWQVMGRHETTFHQRLRLDEYYISNWSLWMDTYILMKTVWIMLSGRGA
jgi:Undecaprenyl-phosphate galactose phosphotransferase WbaP